MAEKVRGYLVITVAEASGRNKDEEEVWEPSFYEGFVKGGSRCLAPASPLSNKRHRGYRAARTSGVTNG